ncbi:MAG: N-acyl homoserine lactonase family protein [Chloroflexia bacterium]|nr:N-acyl homoserine lactonase family protein [Chloroflexia bacterium]
MSTIVHELYLLHLGQLGAGDAATGETHFNQVPGYLIRTATGRTILVDTGNPAVLIGRSDAQPWWHLRNDTRPEDDIVPRLAALGIAPRDVDLLISTHFDFDHCGRHEVFAELGITSVVQRRHLEAARGDPRFDPALWDLPGIDYQAVDGDTELEPGLRLIASSGHVIGHQSVFVETAGGPVLLAIDAISKADQLEMEHFSDEYPDPDAARRSRDRLVALAAETGAYLVLGHDAEQWASLPKSPTPFRRPSRES